MARIIIHKAKKPLVHKTESGDTVAICMCGLSSNYPFCDGSHKMTAEEEEDAVYIYDSEKKRLVKLDVSGIRNV